MHPLDVHYCRYKPGPCNDDNCYIFQCKKTLDVPTLNLREPMDGGPQRVFVVFADHGVNGQLPSRAPDWVRIFTSPGFRHVYVLQPARLGAVIVNQLAQGVAVDWATYDTFACAIACVRAGHRVLSLDTQHDASYVMLEPYTCVSVVKALIGVRHWWIISPRQLYNYLLKHGATEVRE